MKTKSLLLAACAIASFVGAANAATISVTRGTGNPGIIASNLDGGPLATGGYYIAVGTFTNASGVEEVPIITDIASLFSAVQQFDVFQSALSPTSGTTMGVFTGSFTGVGSGTPDVFNSKQMFFMAGNKATKELSDQFAIFKMVPSKLFPANVTATGTTAVSLPNTTVISMVPGAGSISGNNVRMALAVVPETSTALLGALGALGLLRRRR